MAALLIFNISTALRKLKKATHRIAEGDFDFDPGIPPGDEVGDLAEDFARMALRLKDLEQMSLDASPLTRLPGNLPPNMARAPPVTWTRRSPILPSAPS